ncbi:hypothetical protein D3C75_1029830 [compost metagenome]
MGAEQHADEQVGEDHRLAEASEDGHQQDGGEQQDQHIGVHTSLSFICPHGMMRLCIGLLAPSGHLRGYGTGSRPFRALATSGTPGLFTLPFHLVKPSQRLCFPSNIFWARGLQ